MMRMFAALFVAGAMFAGPTAPAVAHETAATAATNAETLDAAARPAAAAVDAFHAALKRSEIDKALSFLTDDALVFEGGAVERSKAEYAASHLAADAAFSAATTTVVTRRLGRTTGNLAWIATESRTTGRYRDRDIDSVGTETMVLRRAATGWRIVHIHWSSQRTTP